MAHTRLIVPLLVLLAALGIRLQPIVGESFHYDAIVYQQAAAEGLAANALDHDAAFRLRRYHPPLVAYIILANNALVGDGNFGARLFAILAGTAACLFVTLSVLVYGGRGGGRSEPGTAAGAMLAGLLLAFLPVHLYISRTANWDAVYSAFSTATLLALAYTVARPSRGSIVSVGVLWALSFLTSELGLALAPAVVAVWWIDRRRDDYAPRDWLFAAVTALVVIAALWPAGVFRLDALRTLRFRWYDSGMGERNAPWWVFYTTLWHQAPAYTVAAVAGLVGLSVAWVRGRRRGDPTFRPLTPLAVYAGTVFLLSTRQRLVYIHHIADLFPALSVLIGAAFVMAFARRRSAAGRAMVAGVALVVVALSAVSAMNRNPEVVGPQEHPGLGAVGEFLLAHPGSHTLFHYTAQMQYYAPGADVTGTPDRGWTADEIASAKTGNYDYVVSDLSMIQASDLIDSPEDLEHALAPQYHLVQVIHHRRTGAPVAWIFAHR